MRRLFLPEVNSEWNSYKIEMRSEPVDQVISIGFFNILGMIAEKGKYRTSRSELRHIFDLYHFTFICRWMIIFDLLAPRQRYEHPLLRRSQYPFGLVLAEKELTRIPLCSDKSAEHIWKNEA